MDTPEPGGRAAMHRGRGTNVHTHEGGEEASPRDILRDDQRTGQCFSLYLHLILSKQATLIFFLIVPSTLADLCFFIS